MLTDKVRNTISVSVSDRFRLACPHLPRLSSSYGASLELIPLNSLSLAAWLLHPISKQKEM